MRQILLARSRKLPNSWRKPRKLKRLATEERPKMTPEGKRSRMMLPLLQLRPRQLVRRVYWKFMARLRTKRRRREKKRLVLLKSSRKSDCRDSISMPTLLWSKSRHGSNLKLVRSVRSETIRTID